MARKMTTQEAMMPLQKLIYFSLMKTFDGSDGDRTRELYVHLGDLGAAGQIAINLFRANKTSVRAKAYRGGIPGRGSYRSLAYGRKQWSLDNLTAILEEHARNCAISWGWGIDAKEPVHKHVLYVDLPTGQVSFHTGERGKGPDYPRKWDGRMGVSTDRIVRWIAGLMATAAEREPRVGTTAQEAYRGQ